jgi:hypothetical protein
MLKDTMWVNAGGEAILCIGKKLLQIGEVPAKSIQALIDSEVRMQIIQDNTDRTFQNGTCDGCDQWQGSYLDISESDRAVVYKTPVSTYLRRTSPLQLDWNPSDLLPRETTDSLIK